MLRLGLLNPLSESIHLLLELLQLLTLGFPFLGLVHERMYPLLLLLNFFLHFLCFQLSGCSIMNGLILCTDCLTILLRHQGLRLLLQLLFLLLKLPQLLPCLLPYKVLLHDVSLAHPLDGLFVLQIGVVISIHHNDGPLVERTLQHVVQALQRQSKAHLVLDHLQGHLRSRWLLAFTCRGLEAVSKESSNPLDQGFAGFFQRALGFPSYHVPCFGSCCGIGAHDSLLTLYSYGCSSQGSVGFYLRGLRPLGSLALTLKS
mmetsp:Transcript_47476/g.79510  ORF Transcript_47476/g.79510 Transcript_47476/m.79510 type:complete len:259 (-) Transcript_47476:1189-1965(-)